MSPKVIILTGAPAASEVDLASSTICHFDAAICQFMGLERDASQLQPPPSSAPLLPPWRVLPLVRQPIPTTTTAGFFSQSHNLHVPPASSDDFFTTAGIIAQSSHSTAASQDAAADDTLTRFCEQSLALLESVDASPSPQQDSMSMSDLTTSDISFATSAGLSNMAMSPPPPVPPHLSDLEDIPPSRHITALNPQTVTVNLIVGIISIALPRTITTKWGRDICLVEILVGDETKSGFAITFWVPVDAVATSSISRLRRQDVVLMQNVALHVFRDKVYGQSLRRDMTKTCLLWRRDGGGQYTTRNLASRSPDPRYDDPQREKTRAVKDWTLHFVGGQPAARKPNGKKSWDEPPDDTQ